MDGSFGVSGLGDVTSGGGKVGGGGSGSGGSSWRVIINRIGETIGSIQTCVSIGAFGNQFVAVVVREDGKREHEFFNHLELALAKHGLMGPHKMFGSCNVRVLREPWKCIDGKTREAGSWVVLSKKDQCLACVSSDTNHMSWSQCRGNSPPQTT